MKTQLLTITMLFVCVIVYGQNDTLQQEIMKMEASKSVLIRNGRELLMGKLIEGNIAKVKEIKDYLLSLESDGYVALYPGEKWLIMFWTKEYEPILNDIRQYNTTLKSAKNKIRPPEDYLFNRLRSHSYENKAKLFQYIEEADLSDEKKELLDMHLIVGLMTDANPPDLTQEQLNDRANWFLHTYPDSFGAAYTREYIRDEWCESNWGWGLEFFIGAGILTDKLKDNFSDHAALGVELSGSYKNFYLHQRDYIGISETRKEFSSPEAVWKKYAEADIFLIELSIGYAALETRKIKLVPFAGIATCDITPPQEEINKYPGLSKFEIDFTTTYTFGANLDIKMGKSIFPFISTFGNEKTYWLMRLRYEYSIPQFARAYPGFDGHMHMITLGIGVFGRKMVRRK